MPKALPRYRSCGKRQEIGKSMPAEMGCIQIGIRMWTAWSSGFSATRISLNATRYLAEVIAYPYVFNLENKSHCLRISVEDEETYLFIKRDN